MIGSTTDGNTTFAGQAPLPGDQSPKSRALAGALKRYAARFDDGEILRWAFRGMLIGAISVLAMDYFEQYGAASADEATDPMQTATPVLPPAVDASDVPASATDPRKFIKTDQMVLARPMQFTLGSNGVLFAEGSIEPGTAARFAAELQARGEYVKSVSLNSPGGAIDDAMEMARQVRARGIGAQVADGALCASSCPLLLAGGKSRLAGAEAAIGIHQFYAVATATDRPKGSAQAMSDAQITTARITRHLAEMGIDPAVWLHALDTPPRALYYLSGDELSKYRLATGIALPRTEAVVKAIDPAG